MSWRTEFGSAYGDDADAKWVRARLEKLGFRDRSWANDENPSWWWTPKGATPGEDDEVAVFIGHPDPDQRDTPRFIPMMMVSGSEIRDWTEVDDPRKAVAIAISYVRKLRKESRARR